MRMSEIQLPLKFFLSGNNLKSGCFITLLAVFCITMVHLMLLKIMLHRYQLPFFDIPNKRDSAADIVTSTKRFEAVKVSYQMTNAFVNLLFGLYGVYVCFYEDGLLVASFDFQSSIANHVFGYEHYLPFAALQVGYNMWSLPVGLLWVKESTTMIAHHVFVIVVCSLSAYTNYASRIHAPFFLGVYELSSVPLALANYFKDHREWVQASSFRTILRDLSKVIFALMFLGVRICMGTPHIFNITSANYWALTVVCPKQDIPWGYRMWIGTVLCCHVSLALLQYYWAVLVVKALVRMVPKSDHKDVKKD